MRHYPGNEPIFSLIRQIQLAPTEPDGWHGFADAIARHTNSTLVALYEFNRAAGSARLGIIKGLPNSAARDYEGYYAARSLTQKDTESMRPGSVFLESMSDAGALRHCEAYNEFFLPRNLDHLALMNICQDGGTRVTFTLRRGRDAKPYGEEEISLLEFLFPFLRLSIDIWTRMDALRGMEHAVNAAMDRLPHGVLLLDGHGRLLFANRSADAILAANDGLTLSKLGCCHAAHADEDQRLSALITACAGASAGRDLHPGGAMAVSRPSQKRCYGVHVFPIPMESLVFDAHRPAVGLFITDPERNHQPPQHFLAELFGLSPAEERLAALLMEGLALKECAQRMEITQNTARSYMKSVFSKTGVSRQSDLIRLLLSSVPPMGG